MLQPLSGLTRLVPVLAYPVDHVRAPRVYNPAFAAAGLDWCQVPMGVHPDDLAATLAQLARISNLQGLNLTIPHKAAAQACCRWLGPEARRTGVVNTMRRQPDGSWAGESFDGVGFVAAARHHGLLRLEQPVLIVGTGGAGTAIAFALAAAGAAELLLANRDPARAEQLAASLRAEHPALICRVLVDWNGAANAATDAATNATTNATTIARAGLAVNATSLGLHPDDPLPLDPALLAADAGVFDIIAARDTEWMAACQALGLAVLGGRPMIDHQVAAQIAFWRGDDFPLELQP